MDTVQILYELLICTDYRTRGGTREAPMSTLVDLSVIPMGEAASRNPSFHGS